jgi:plastocyanin
MRAALSALVCAALGLGAALPASARDGSVSGTVSVGLAQLALADLGHAVVYLEPLDAPGDAQSDARAALSLRQHAARFEPAFLAVALGQPILMPNDDTIYHNVFSYSRPNDFDLGLYRAGESRTLRFEHPGPVRLYCSIHENMNGLIFVAPSRWFAVPDARGAFTIAGVSPGRYRLTLWTERTPQQAREIRVAAGTEERVELRVALPAGN